jgi:hypothetical protein
VDAEIAWQCNSTDTYWEGTQLSAGDNNNQFVIFFYLLMTVRTTFSTFHFSLDFMDQHDLLKVDLISARLKLIEAVGSKQQCKTVHNVELSHGIGHLKNHKKGPVKRRRWPLGI